MECIYLLNAYKNRFVYSGLKRCYLKSLRDKSLKRLLLQELGSPCWHSVGDDGRFRPISDTSEKIVEAVKDMYVNFMRSSTS